MFKSSVCSYENRGPYGNNKYRGNCSGFIVKDFIESYMRKPNGLVADPSVGGGSSIDVANELGVRFKGTDLHQGFNLLRDDFLSFLGEPAHLIWWHPPYWDMIQYSGKQWGEPNKWDMSRMNLPEFVEALELAVMNIHDACERGGHYGILMGNLRRDGDYFNLSSLVERIAPGKLRTIGWCKRNHLTLAGLPYEDNLAGSDGISIEIITPPGMSREMLEQAVREGYSERDVVRHRILECPVGWFMEADGKAFDHEVFHDYVVAHGYGEPSSEAYELAERWFWQGNDYALIAAEIVARDLCVRDDEDED